MGGAGEDEVGKRRRKVRIDKEEEVEDEDEVVEVVAS